MLQKVMLLFRSLLRFSLLLLLCALLVYAPEILCASSRPYSLAAPQRVLLRIALCCDSEAASHLQRRISDYQKLFPHVHLRITQISEDRLAAMSAPYPDIVLCSESLGSELVPAFECAACYVPFQGGQPILCALSHEQPANKAALAFAAYIDEATLPG